MGDPREIEALREVVRVYEMHQARGADGVSNLELLAQSRLFPLFALCIKVARVGLGFARRVRGTTPAHASAVVAPLEGEATVALPPEEAYFHQPLGRAAITATKKGLTALQAVTRVAIKGHPAQTSAQSAEVDPYVTWVAENMTPTDAVRFALKRRIPLLEDQPLLSIVMATYNTDHAFLVAAIESVRAQIYDRFELLIADDCSPDAEVRAIVERYAALDARIKLITRSENGNISAATNSAIAEATGEWLVFMDHDDELVEHALLHVVLEINAHRDAAIIYSDEDKIDELGRPFMPYFKSDFDPLLLLGQNYICHLTTVRRQLVAEVGGLRSAFDGAQDWDLMLRITERIDRSQVRHIPHVLYHWRSHAESTSKTSAAKPWALEAGRRAVTDAMARRGIDAEVHEVEGTGFAEVRFALPEQPPKVSILIPTRDGKYLRTSVTSVLERTTYPNFEVVVIDNGSVKDETMAFFAELSGKITVLRDDSPFSYSALHNRAVPKVDGEVLLLLNDDTEILDGRWLAEMVALLCQEGVGAVGAKLLYGDSRIQHAGVLLGPNGLAAHVGRLHAREDKGYFGRTALASEFQAVTAACMAVRREVWEELGGLDEHFQVAWNDVDFCLRVRRAGHQVAYTPRAELVHYESVSRGLDVEGPAFLRSIGEIRTMRERWGYEILRDRYYNPNLSFGQDIFHLAWPPRVSPWYTGIE